MDFLEWLIEFTASHCGSLLSAKKISDFLKSQRVNIAPNRVLDYLSHLQSAFFIHRVKRKQIPGKKIFEIGEKLYFEDIGIRNALIGYRQADIGQLLENAVHNHLQAHGFTIRVGSLDHGEVDFVAEKQGQTLYLQVCYLLSDDNVRNREFGNLEKTPDNYPKTVLSMDEDAGGNVNGIVHRHIRDFLSDPPL